MVNLARSCAFLVQSLHRCAAFTPGSTPGSWRQLSSTRSQLNARCCAGSSSGCGCVKTRSFRPDVSCVACAGLNLTSFCALCAPVQVARILAGLHCCAGASNPGCCAAGAGSCCAAGAGSPAPRACCRSAGSHPVDCSQRQAAD